jgi:hypothetical protein
MRLIYCISYAKERKKMRLVILLLSFVVVFALADVYRMAGTQYTGAGSFPPPGTDDYTISVVNTFDCPYTSSILGLEFVDADDHLIFMSNTVNDERLWVANASNGSQVNSFPLPWDTPDPFGVGDYSSAGFQPHCNDYNDVLIWYTSDFNVSYDNHYDQYGRGMDGTEIFIYEAYGPVGAVVGAVCWFYPDGTGVHALLLPGITSQLSGLTTFPYSGTLGLAVTTYNPGLIGHFIWLYQYNRDGFDLIGTAQVPSCDMSLGLAYSSSRGTFFWSWTDVSYNFHISELSITGLAMEQSTWGAIKTSF